MRLSTRRIRLLGLAFLLAPALGGAVLSPAAEAKQRARIGAHSASIATTFRLDVTGQPAPGTTFWVAYGPLDGHWGVIRLSPHGSGVYSAWAVLPATGRTTFAYLAAQGTIQTRLGAEPGGVPTTITLLGPTTATAVSRITVHWHVPAG